MSRRKKLRYIIPIVVILFIGAYGRHRYLKQESNVVGHLPSKAMDEISGIAASGINPDLYYVHNDSEDTSRIFAITPDGELKSTIYFNGDPKARHRVRDAEDIAVGPGPDKRKSYVYLGDIGDNEARHGHISIYRLEEKKAWAGAGITHSDQAPLYLKYPDGRKDAETLMLDPVEKLLYIVSKREDSVTVYTTPLLYKTNDTVVLTRRCKLFFPGMRYFRWITGGDISKDGQQVLLKSYVKVYYWRRMGNEPIWKTMQRKPRLLPYTEEKQGEAIGFTPDGKGYYTTSEGVFSPIYYYSIPK